MAKKPTTLEADALQKVEPIAKLLGKTASQLWKIFLFRYIAKGVAQIFLAVFINIICFVYLTHSHPYNLWMLIPLAVGGVLVYDAIQLLVDPYYFAMNDVLYRLKTEKNTWGN